MTRYERKAPAAPGIPNYALDVNSSMVPSSPSDRAGAQRRPRLLGLWVLAVALAALLTPGCGPRPGTAIPAAGNTGDAPEDLDSKQDLDDALSRYRALPGADSTRAGRRDALIHALIRRAEIALGLGRRDEAFRAVLDLCHLFLPEEIDSAKTMATALAPAADLLERMHRLYARSGQTEPAALIITLRRAALPERKSNAAGAAAAPSEMAAKLDEELALLYGFADELAMTALGEHAIRARPIEILSGVVDALPTRREVDQLARLLVERQRALALIFRTQGPSVEIIRAHGEGVIRTTWHLVRMFARAHRLAEVEPYLNEVAGLGDDAVLKATLDAALGHTTVTDAESIKRAEDAWLALAAQFVTDREEQVDLSAARQIVALGRQYVPTSARLAERAGELARAQDDPHPARLAFGEAFALAPSPLLATAILELDDAEVGRLVFTERPIQARKLLESALAFEASVKKRWPGAKRRIDRAAMLETYGLGLVQIGELAAARRYLEASIELVPRRRSLEVLATMAAKLSDHDRALPIFERALALPQNGLEDAYAHLKVQRAAADAYWAAKRPDRAKAMYLACVTGWEQIPTELPPRFAGERLIEMAKSRWALGETERALDLFDQAVDADPNGADTYIGVVAHLISHGQFDRALDAYHRGMGSADVDDYFKVYMSLWIIADARRLGRAANPIAVDYLASRQSPLWYDQLARFASGRASRDEMLAKANSRTHRAELLYYVATISEPALSAAQQREYLEAVIDTEMIMFFEFDMAKMWLESTR